jgi:two-component system response regulator NreC
MSDIRLILVDDHEVVRTGLKAYFSAQPGIVVVADVSNGAQAIELIEQMRPDLVVMDIGMPGMDGLETTRLLKARYPQVQVLALTVYDDKQHLFEMLAAGASGYLTKQAAAEELVTAVRIVASGQVYLQPALARWLLDDYRRLLSDAPENRVSHNTEMGKDLDILSKRERQVLELVAEGKTNPQIGSQLGISPKTVARHRERIMSKLDMHTAADLVKFAIRTGLIDTR